MPPWFEALDRFLVLDPEARRGEQSGEFLGLEVGEPSADFFVVGLNARVVRHQFPTFRIAYGSDESEHAVVAKDAAEADQNASSLTSLHVQEGGGTPQSIENRRL